MVMTVIVAHPPTGKPAFTRKGFRRGFGAALPFILSNGVAGVVMGAAYKSLGLGFVPAILFSLVVYSATAQSVTIAMWTLPPPISAMVVACVATNARYLLMGAHLHRLFGHLRRRIMFPVLFLLADASWAMTSADAERNHPDAGYLLGASVPMAIGWIGGTGLGYQLPLKPGGPLTVAAALLPAAFVVTLLPTQWRGQRTIAPWVLSAICSLLISRLIGANWAMLIGGSIGTTLSLIRGDDD